MLKPSAYLSLLFYDHPQKKKKVSICASSTVHACLFSESLLPSSLLGNACISIFTNCNECWKAARAEWNLNCSFAPQISSIEEQWCNILLAASCKGYLQSTEAFWWTTHQKPARLLGANLNYLNKAFFFLFWLFTVFLCPVSACFMTSVMFFSVTPQLCTPS